MQINQTTYLCMHFVLNPMQKHNNNMYFGIIFFVIVWVIWYFYGHWSCWYGVICTTWYLVMWNYANVISNCYVFLYTVFTSFTVSNVSYSWHNYAFTYHHSWKSNALTRVAMLMDTIIASRMFYSTWPANHNSITSIIVLIIRNMWLFI